LDFSDLGFSQDLDNFLLDGLVFERIWMNRIGFGFFGFSGYRRFYINKLLIQMYTAESACTIAELPDFRAMVITADLVFHRKIQQKFNVNSEGRFTWL
jgi:hypothetical protein